MQMNRRLAYALAGCVFVMMVASASAADRDRTQQQFRWRFASPVSQGMSRARLDDLRKVLAAKKTNALLVIRNDRIVYRWYARGYNPGKRHGTASLAKALVGGMSLAVAMSDGMIGLDDPACKYVRQWKSDPVKSRITVRHLATHMSGIEDAELSKAEAEAIQARGDVPDAGHMALPGWKGRFWNRVPELFVLARDRAPVISPPGSEFHYSNPGMGMLSYAITAAIQKGLHKDVRALLRKRVMKPLDISDEQWQIGYGQTFHTDGLDLVANWGGGEFTPLAAARIGRVMLRRGDWQGKQIIKPEVVDVLLRRKGCSDGSRGDRRGICWWVNHDKSMASLPEDAFAGAGQDTRYFWSVPAWTLLL